MRLCLLLAALPLALLASCQHHADTPAPAPKPCYTGVVLGTSCYDGLLIEVDAATPIGRSLNGRSNVIGALNVAAIGSLGRAGQRLYFTCGRDTAGYANFGACPANSLPANIPHMVLPDFSSTTCPQMSGDGR